MSYLGSKAGEGVWQRIAAEIPPHQLLIVPFAGHCALSRKLQPPSQRLLFEVDESVFDWWDRLPADEMTGITVRNACGIEFLESLADACDREDFLPIPGPWHDAPPDDVCSELEWFDRHAVIYCDPPYLIETRTSHESRYRYDMTDADHERLLSVIRRIPCRVLISGYYSQLYAERLHDWRLVTFNANCRGTTKTRREHLWINREPIEVAHMPLMTGTNKVQRQAIKRRLERIEQRAARIALIDVEHWIACLSKRRSSGTGSPILTPVDREFVGSRSPQPTGEQPILTATAATSYLEAPQSESTTCDRTFVSPRWQPSTETVSGPAVSNPSADVGRRIEVKSKPIVLALFPGIGLLDSAFRESGFEIIEGPDLIFGADIRQFSSAAFRGVVSGVIGGPPCQNFSAANPERDHNAGMEMVREFVRIVDECQPDWFLVENVPQVPDIRIDGYSWQRCPVHNEWFPQRDDVCARRHRVFQFGTRTAGPLTDRLLDLRKPLDAPTWRKDQLLDCVFASRQSNLNWRAKARLMGLPDEWDVPLMRRDELAHAIGNGVPLPMGGFVAAAVAAAIDGSGSNVSSQTPRCSCPCQLPLDKKRRDQRYYSGRCRQDAMTRRQQGK